MATHGDNLSWFVLIQRCFGCLYGRVYRFTGRLLNGLTKPSGVRAHRCATISTTKNQEKYMSDEYRPVHDILYLSIDARLEKHGIKLEQPNPGLTVLISPVGQLCVTPEGSSTNFVGDRAVIDILETEYGIAIVNEDDHRFSGFSSLEE